MDRIRTFYQFLNSESHSLVKFASQPGFVIQQSYNSVQSGSIALAAESLVNLDKQNVLLLRQSSQRPHFNPHPALLKTLDGHKFWILSVSLTPDGKLAISG